MQRQTHLILKVPISFLDYDDVSQAITSWRRLCERHYICLTNPHAVMLCQRDRDMQEATRGAAFALPDGIGVALAGRVLYRGHFERVTGPTLLLRVCDAGRSAGLRHFFYGGAAGVADKLAARLCQSYPGLHVAGTDSPPFRTVSLEEDDALVESINRTSPDIVWVGLGAPKQEKWMAAHAGRIHATAMIGVGAAFDFHSGNVKWAPGWVRKMGCEWAYRLLQDPKRMWRRNVDGAAYAALVLNQFLWERLSTTPIGRSAGKRAA